MFVEKLVTLSQMIKIYHNPRCSKSRQALDLLEASGQEFETIKYLEEIPSKRELAAMIKKLKIAPIDLVRKQEKIWKENYKGKEMSDREIISAMVEHPTIIERPIVINGNKAAIGRPIENIEDVLD